MIGGLLRSALKLGVMLGGAALAKAALRQRHTKPPADAAPRAHQTDGTDASASFAAGIADENTVPDNTPISDESLRKR